MFDAIPQKSINCRAITIKQKGTQHVYSYHLRQRLVEINNNNVQDSNSSVLYVNNKANFHTVWQIAISAQDELNCKRVGVRTELHLSKIAIRTM